MIRGLGAAGPVMAVLLALVALWAVAVVPMNIRLALSQAERAGAAVVPEGAVARQAVPVWRLVAANTFAIPGTYALDRPRLPAPHQVWRDFSDNTFGRAVTSKRSLVYHGWVTLAAALNGFALGTALGILLAVGIVYARVMEMGVMPLAIISQTVPIVAIAPMIIVLVAALGVEGRAVPKAIISAYLCFFPILVGMVKGLRSPDTMKLDLLRTYSASGAQTFWKLRVPASLPYLFASLKVGAAAALVGTIVGELPTGAVEGLGARILIGDQFGTPVQIWSALFATAILAGAWIGLLNLVERLVRWRMGARA
ncbi:MAG: ABC transporter permease subunit [Pseudomonadota bacterium]